MQSREVETKQNNEMQGQIWVNQWFFDFTLTFWSRSPQLEISLLGNSLFCVFLDMEEEAKALKSDKTRFES